MKLIVIILGWFMLNSAVSNTLDDTIIKSPSDNRDYRYVMLENGLKVILVSDSQADKAAVSMNIPVGSGHDPKNAQGLAHFLEHMLFLGTEKFPKPDGYQEFVQKHGGHTNAYTAYDQTNYFFDIDNDYLKPALEQFSQFFISPLFNEEYATRERNIVDSEYHARRSDEYRRTWSARRQVFNPEHPVSNFSIGNNETLADREGQSIRSELIKFYETYYSSNVMSLAVIGAQSLDELESWVNAEFSAIKNRNYTPRVLTQPLYVDGQLPAVLTVKPLQEKRNLSVSFALPEMHSSYKTKPSSYLSNLIGHEGVGSLLSWLKSQDYANGLSAGLELSHVENASIVVSIDLTQAGIEQWPQIVTQLFGYIELMKDATQQKWRYEEQSKLSRLNFDFQRRVDAADYAVFLTSSLEDYPYQEILSAPLLMEEYDLAIIDQVLEKMNPDNAMITITGQDQPTQDKTPYYHTEFKLQKPDAAHLEQWRNAKPITDLYLPSENQFIPEDVAMHAAKDATSEPVNISTEEHLDFWYKNDTDFDIPRANLNINLRSALVGQSAKNDVLDQLFARIATDQLNELLYPAYLADLNASIYAHMRGVSIRFSGFNDKLAHLIEPVLNELINFGVSQAIFDRKKEELARRYRDITFQTPYQQLYQQANDILLQNSWPNTAKLAVVDSITRDDLLTFAKQFFEQLEVAVLLHGNISMDDAVKSRDLISGILKETSKFESIAHGQIAKLKSNTRYINQLKVDHTDKAAAIIYKATDASVQSKANMYMLYQVIEAPFFYELRTVQQLGYIVNVSPFLAIEHPGIAMIVEAASTEAVDIVKSMDEFIASFEATLVELDDADFELAKQGLIVRINKNDENLDDRTSRYWNEIDRDNTLFDSRVKLVEAINKLSKADTISYFKQVFGQTENGAFGHVLVTTPDAAFDEQKENTVLIKDVPEFKQNADYYERN